MTVVGLEFRTVTQRPKANRHGHMENLTAEWRFYVDLDGGGREHGPWMLKRDDAKVAMVQRMAGVRGWSLGADVEVKS